MVRVSYLCPEINLEPRCLGFTYGENEGLFSSSKSCEEVKSDGIDNVAILSWASNPYDASKKAIKMASLVLKEVLNRGEGGAAVENVLVVRGMHFTRK